MRTGYWVVPVVLLMAIAAIAQDQSSAVTISAGKNELKQRSKTKIELEFNSDVSSWQLSCDHVEILGWESPIPVTIVGRTADGEYNAVSGQQFKAGQAVKLDVKRTPGTKKGETGQCNVTFNAGDRRGENSVKFAFQ